jgi:hypothetical protein
MSTLKPFACHALPVFRPRIIVYATIIQLATFAVYTPGPVPFTFRIWINFLLVSFGPMIAVGVAHMFSDLLDLHLSQGRAMSWSTIRRLAISNLQFLYVGLVPLVLTAPFLLMDVIANTMVNLVFVAGIVSLFAWGLAAARHSGQSLRGQIGYGLGYAGAGFLITLLELYLRHIAT